MEENMQNNMQESKKVKSNSNAALIIVVFIIILLILALVAVIAIKKKQTVSIDPGQNVVTQQRDNGDYIYRGEIQSIVIKYFVGYNYATGEAIQDTIPLNTIVLEAEDFNSIKEQIKTLTKYEDYEKFERNYGLIHILDYYRIEINEDFVIYIGDEFGCVENEDIHFEVPKDLYGKVQEIAKKYNESKLYKTINSDKITIICEQEKLEVTDEEQLDELKNFQYYIINSSDDKFVNEKVAYTLDLNNGTKIDIYYASVLSCIYYEDGTHDYIYTSNLKEIIEKIFNNSKVKLNDENVDVITVTYKKQKYEIKDKNEIEKLLKEFKNFEYNDFPYLASYTEAKFDDEDIFIYVNNTKYIIQGQRMLASRYYIDPNGKVYEVSGLYNNDLEKYFRDLVGWTEQ